MHALGRGLLLVVTSVLGPAACVEFDVFPAPSGRTRLVVFESRGTYEVYAYEATELSMPRLAARSPGSRVWQLGYDATVEQLHLVKAPDGRVELDAAGVRLPRPAAWTASPQDDEVSDPAGDAAQLSAMLDAVRVERACLRLERPAPGLDVGPGRSVTLVASTGMRSALLGVTHESVSEIVDNKEVKRWVSPGYFAHATPQGLVRDRSLDIGDVPIGFVDADGDVWATFSSSTGAERSLCRFPGGEVSPIRCRPMVFEGPPPSWRPHAMMGRHDATHGMELVALNLDRGLYHWRESEGTWRLIHRAGREVVDAEDDPCRVGVQTLALTMDGPGTGLVSFPIGPLLRYRIPDQGSPILTTEFPEPELCRTSYVRMPGGVEALVATELRSPMALSPTSRLWLRRDARAGWIDVTHRLPAESRIKPRALTELMGALVLPYEPRSIGTLDLSDAFDGVLHACPSTDVDSEAQILVYTGEALIAAGTSPTAASGLTVDWLWPCSTADDRCGDDR